MTHNLQNASQASIGISVLLLLFWFSFRESQYPITQQQQNRMPFSQLISGRFQWLAWFVFNRLLLLDIPISPNQTWSSQECAPVFKTWMAHFVVKTWERKSERAWVSSIYPTSISSPSGLTQLSPDGRTPALLHTHSFFFGVMCFVLCGSYMYYVQDKFSSGRIERISNLLNLDQSPYGLPVRWHYEEILARD